MVAFDQQSPPDPLLHSESPHLDQTHPQGGQVHPEDLFSRPSPPLSPASRSSQQSPMSDLTLITSTRTPPNGFFPYDAQIRSQGAQIQLPQTSSAMQPPSASLDWLHNCAPSNHPLHQGADYMETLRFHSTHPNSRPIPQYRTPPPYLMDTSGALAAKMGQGSRTRMETQSRALSPAGYPSWNYSTMTPTPPPNYHAQALQQQQHDRQQRHMYQQELMFHQHYAHQQPPHQHLGVPPPPPALQSSSRNAATYSQSLRRQQQLQLQQMEASEFMRRQHLQQYGPQHRPAHPMDQRRPPHYEFNGQPPLENYPPFLL